MDRLGDDQGLTQGCNMHALSLRGLKNEDLWNIYVVAAPNLTFVNHAQRSKAKLFPITLKLRSLNSDLWHLCRPTDFWLL